MRGGHAQQSCSSGLDSVGGDLVFVGTLAAHGQELYRLSAPPKAYVAPAELGATTSREWALPLPIPASVGLEGHSLIVQSVAIRPQLATSNALHLVIGRR